MWQEVKEKFSACLPDRMMEITRGCPTPQREKVITSTLSWTLEANSYFKMSMTKTRLQNSECPELHSFLLLKLGWEASVRIYLSSVILNLVVRFLPFSQKQLSVFCFHYKFWEWLSGKMGNMLYKCSNTKKMHWISFQKIKIRLNSDFILVSSSQNEDNYQELNVPYSVPKSSLWAQNVAY